MAAQQAVLTKEARHLCWQARDLHFACLDAQQNPKACWRTLKAFTKACPEAWQKHFLKARADAARLEALTKLTAEPRYKESAEQK